MSIKLIILKSGENIISNIKEGLYEDKLVCYLLEDPCIININGTYSIDGKNQHSITFNRWPLLSKDVKIELVPDFILTIVEPEDKIKDLYKKKIIGENVDNDNKNSIIIE